MSDVKLFRIDDGFVHELPGEALQVEKSLQVLFEANLEQLLGIRFLATEHSTASELFTGDQRQSSLKKVSLAMSRKLGMPARETSS